MIAAMQGELEREMAILGKADPAAYYLGYTLTDSDHAEVVGSNGALLNSQQSHNRWLEAQVRVGGFDLDNTHSTRERQRRRIQGSYGESVPIEDDAGVLRRAMWRETDEQYRAAAEAFVKVKHRARTSRCKRPSSALPIFRKEKPQCLLMARARRSLWTGSPGKRRPGCTRSFSGSRRRF